MRTIYMNENGRAVCGRHGGTYLTYAIKNDPKAVEYDTPADNWVVVSGETLEDFDLSCETCGA